MKCYNLSSFSVIFLIVCCNYFVASAPQIFADTYGHCDYRLHPVKKRDKMVSKTFTLSDKVWTIGTNDFILYFSFCKSTIKECFNRSNSCLIRKQNDEFINLGLEFRTVYAVEFILKSFNGSKCPSSNRNYSLTVNFGCSNIMKAKPQLVINDDEDECHVEVNMLRPDCKPRCTDNIAGTYLIDIRKFPKNIEIQSGSRNFSLNLCQLNPKCGSYVSSCELLPNSSIPLASTESQSINYDVAKNQLTARGRYKQGRVTRDILVLIKCNWDTEISNPKYRQFKEQGKHYKFELESSYGCVKLPHSCTAFGLENLNYNLSLLFKENGWDVANVRQGQISLNICGLAKHSSDVCSRQYSQVCYFNGTNYMNMGSILSLSVHQDFLKAVFVSGSTCKENSTLLYSTEIQFRCSPHENGPVFKQLDQCLLILTWDTPHACPVDVHKASNCYMVDRYGSRNLQKIYSQTDKTFHPTPATEVVYNLCGPIHSSCNNFTDVSFCLKFKDQERVLGWDSRDLISEQGLLRMEFLGARCSNNESRGEVFVYFVCSYDEYPPSPVIIVIEDGCKLNVTVFTHLACLTQNNFVSCLAKSGDQIFNLTNLAQKNKNYIITSDDNVEYIFNLCGPVVTTASSLCRGDTMICLRNRTEVDLKKQFVSLGSVGRPVIVNNGLLIEATMGNFCRDQGHYKTIFNFECSLYSRLPYLLKQDPCIYQITWETPYACPLYCNIRSIDSNITLDFAKIQEKSIKVILDNDTDSYEFHLCKYFYIRNFDGFKETLPLTRKLYVVNNRSYLLLDLNKNCKQSCLGKVEFEMQCSDKNRGTIEQKSFGNYTLSVLVSSPIFCREEKSDLIRMINDTPVIPTRRECTVTSPTTYYHFKLSEIESAKAYLKNNMYSVNFNGQAKDCLGLLCKDDVEVISADQCPNSFFNLTERVITLHYLSKPLCNSSSYMHVEVLLFCDKYKTQQTLTEIDQCKLLLQYYSPNVCLLFKMENLQSNAIVASPFPVLATVGGLIGVILLISGLSLCYFNRRKICRSQYVSIVSSAKNSVPVYRKNAIL